MGTAIVQMTKELYNDIIAFHGHVMYNVFRFLEDQTDLDTGYLNVHVYSPLLPFGLNRNITSFAIDKKIVDQPSSAKDTWFMLTEDGKYLEFRIRFL